MIIFIIMFFSFQIIVKKSEKSGFFLFDFCKKEVIIIGASGKDFMNNGTLLSPLAIFYYKVPPFLRSKRNGKNIRISFQIF